MKKQVLDRHMKDHGCRLLRQGEKTPFQRPGQKAHGNPHGEAATVCGVVGAGFTASAQYTEQGQPCR